MILKRFFLTIGTLLVATACFAQQWEVGGTAGASFLKSAPVTSPFGSATAGFQSGGVFGGYFAQNMYKHLSGELHYTYLMGDMKVTGGGTQFTFGGQSHAFNYDLVYHTKLGRSRATVFVALGGGARLYRGTGTETAFQPTVHYAILTHTQSIKPMLDFGGGVRFELAHNLSLRTEFRDFITAFPTQVITPYPGGKITGLLHDFVPMVTLSYAF
jgi:hypothetical protein